MQISRIRGFTRILGKQQGYLGLPVRDGFCEIDGEQYHKITVAFEPMPDEIEKIIAGAPVELTLLCFTPPPMLMGVGELPQDQEPSLEG